MKTTHIGIILLSLILGVLILFIFRPLFAIDNICCNSLKNNDTIYYKNVIDTEPVITKTTAIEVLKKSNAKIAILKVQANNTSNKVKRNQIINDIRNVINSTKTITVVINNTSTSKPTDPIERQAQQQQQQQQQQLQDNEKWVQQQQQQQQK